jgi:hypothetical protein
MSAPTAARRIEIEGKAEMARRAGRRKVLGAGRDAAPALRHMKSAAAYSAR